MVVKNEHGLVIRTGPINHDVVEADVAVKQERLVAQIVEACTHRYQRLSCADGAVREGATHNRASDRPSRRGTGKTLRRWPVEVRTGCTRELVECASRN